MCYATTMNKKVAKGARGSWFAVVDGELLPCVHKFWWTKGGLYNDPFIKDSPKTQELYQAIKTLGRVILTDDTPTYGDDGKLAGFERTKYIAIWAVENAEFDSNGLRFKFTKSLAPLK